MFCQLYYILYCRCNVLLITYSKSRADTLFCNIQEVTIRKECHTLHRYQTIQNVNVTKGHFDLRVWHWSNSSTTECKKLRNMKTKWIPTIWCSVYNVKLKSRHLYKCYVTWHTYAQIGMEVYSFLTKWERNNNQAVFYMEQKFTLCKCEYCNLLKIKNQLYPTKYAVLLPQHVSGTNMPIIRSTINRLTSAFRWPYLESRLGFVVLGCLEWALLGRCGLTSRATSSEQRSLQETQCCKTRAAFQVWPPKSGSYLLTLWCQSFFYIFAHLVFKMWIIQEPN
jgi:hypothetical protein